VLKDCVEDHRIEGRRGLLHQLLDRLPRQLDTVPTYSLREPFTRISRPQRGLRTRLAAFVEPVGGFISYAAYGGGFLRILSEIACQTL
jgi:hypothetical protein